MIRGTTEDPRFLTLAEMIGGRLRAAGVITLLLDLAGRYDGPAFPCCRDGNVGRFTDEEIAAFLGWDGDPGALIGALVRSRWLQPMDGVRLYLVGWDDSLADRTVHAWLAREGKVFANDRPPDLSRISKKDRAKLGSPPRASGRPRDAERDTRIAERLRAGEPPKSIQRDERVSLATVYRIRRFLKTPRTFSKCFSKPPDFLKNYDKNSANLSQVQNSHSQNSVRTNQKPDKRFPPNKRSVEKNFVSPPPRECNEIASLTLRSEGKPQDDHPLTLVLGEKHPLRTPRDADPEQANRVRKQIEAFHKGNLPEREMPRNGARIAVERPHPSEGTLDTGLAREAQSRTTAKNVEIPPPRPADGLGGA